jgi:hypothetical protein
MYADVPRSPMTTLVDKEPYKELAELAAERLQCGMH